MISLSFTQTAAATTQIGLGGSVIRDRAHNSPDLSPCIADAKRRDVCDHH